MASIVQIGGKFRALVRLKGYPPKSKYCMTRAEAEAWGVRVERELRQGIKIRKGQHLTVAEAVRIYRREMTSAGLPIEAPSNTHYILEHLAADLGAEPIAALIPSRLKRWAEARSREGAGGYTVNMELSALGTVLRAAGAILDTHLPDVVGAARPLLHQFQLISGGNKRTRRPQGDEFERALGWFAVHRPAQRDAILAAVLTGLRRGEICRVMRVDLDEAQRAVLVRQRKRPRRKERVDEWVPLFGEAWELFAGQPAAEDGRVFPIHPQTLTKNWQLCREALGIPGLRLHDLRREANHRMEQAGLPREMRMVALGHRAGASHDHYVAFTPQELHARFRK